MDIRPDWEIAAGTIVGRDHRRINKNNQDAHHVIALPHAIVATICDGCGSGPYSEVGAQIGARMLTAEIIRELGNQPATPDTDGSRINRALSRAAQTLLAQICLLAKNMGGSFSQTINDYFLFTVIGTVITPEFTVLFSLGDGLIGINGEVAQLGPFPGNYPPYLAYELVRDESQPHFSPLINRLLPTSQVQSLILGSDGTFEFSTNANRNLPGSNEILGPLDQFWYDDRYFANPDNLRRRLTLANREMKTANWHTQKLDIEHGLLSDDTTIVVIRRTKEV